MTKKTLTIGTASAPPGTKAKGNIPIANRPDGSTIYLPIMIVNGSEEGPTLGIDGGTHGDEYEGPEAIHHVVAELDPSKLRGTLIAVPVVNILAFQAMQRVTPHDSLSYPDLNRNYPGSPDGALTARIAHTHLTEVVARTEVIITIHSGATIAMLPPKVIYHETDNEFGRKSLEVAKAFGWEILWRDGSYPGTLHGAAERLGIVCIAPEFGGTDRMPHLRQERIDKLSTGTFNVMKYLDMLDGEPELPPIWHIVEGESHVFANHGGIIKYEPELNLGGPVAFGQKLASIVDLFGDEVETIIAPYDGLLIFLRTVPVVQSGDWLVGIGKNVRLIKH